MGRLILLVLLGFVAALYFPDSRAWVLDVASPALQPLYGWQTEQEMEEIADELRDYERENFGSLPTRRSWPEWLEENNPPDRRVDAWGNSYFFQTRLDSFYIASAGPDRIYQTEDDLEISRAMSRPDRN